MASEGPNDPGAAADDNTYGTVAWTVTLAAVISSNDAYATCGFTSTAVSHGLKCTNFGFSIPTGAVITGIKVEWELSYSGIVASDFEAVYVVHPTSGDWNIDSSGSGPLTGTDDYYDFGGDGQLWGTTWTADNINSSSFGCNLVLTAAGVSTARCDHVRMTVYYTNIGDIIPPLAGTTQTSQAAADLVLFQKREIVLPY